MRHINIKDHHATELLDKVKALSGQDETEAVIRVLELYRERLVTDRNPYFDTKKGSESLSDERSVGVEENCQISSLLGYLNVLAFKPMSSRSREGVDAQILAERNAWDE